MSTERLTREQLLTNKSAKALASRSLSLGKAIEKLQFFPETMKSEDFTNNHPSYEVTDPSVPDFVDNTIRLGTTIGAIRDTTIPALTRLKKHNDAVLNDKIETKEQEQLSLTVLTEANKSAMLTHLGKQLEKLQELHDSGVTATDTAVHIVKARMKALEKHHAIEQPVTISPSTHTQNFEGENEFTLSGGETITSTSEIKNNLLKALLTTRFDKSEVAEILFGENTPQTRDYVDSWINKLNSEDLEEMGYSIHEISIDEKNILAIIKSTDIVNEIKKVQTQALKKERTSTSTPDEDVPKKEYSSEIPESRLATLEHILSINEVTRETILQKMGQMSNGKNYGWPTALMALGTTRTKLYSHVNRGTASVREIKISDAMVRFAPKGLTRFEASKHFGKEIKRILKENESGYFGTLSLDMDSTVSQPLTENPEVIIEEIPEFIDELVEIQGEESLEENDKPNLTTIALAIAQSIHELPEELEEIRKKLAETGTLGKFNQTDELKKLYEILTEEATAAEYILSFDDEDTLSLLYYLEENKEIIHDLLPSEKDNEEFEIGPNGQLIIKGQEPEKPKVLFIETQVKDIREMVRKRIRDTRSQIAGDSITFFQITGAFKGVSTSDINTAINEKLVRPHRGKEGREAFTLTEVATILLRKDLKKTSLNNKAKNELRELFIEETKIIIQEEKEKKN